MTFTSNDQRKAVMAKLNTNRASTRKFNSKSVGSIKQSEQNKMLVQNHPLETSYQIHEANNAIEGQLWKILKKSEIPYELQEKMLAGFSRTTDPNSSFGYTEIVNAWNEAIKLHPELTIQKQILQQHEDRINQRIKKKLENTTSLYRGMRGDELDDIIKTGEVKPYQYSFVSFTLDKDAGLGFGRNASDVDGVTVEFDKNAIAKQKMWNGTDLVMLPTHYSAFHDHVGIGGEEIDGDYPISYADEMEVRSYEFKVNDTIKSITIHDQQYMEKGDAEKLLQKWKKAFPSVHISIKHYKQ